MEFTAAARHLDRALDSLRQANNEEFVCRGLLARAAFHRLRAAATADGASANVPDAASDLREAEEIAERGHMRLHLADVHLEWTRLHLAAGDRDAARGRLERARQIVRETGYGRREREVAYLECWGPAGAQG